MLVGRESERRTIEVLLAAARVADSRVLVLVGEPGIGKSALLDFAATAAEGMRVLRTQGVASERFVPFAGLLQLLRPLVGLLDHIPEPQARALSSALALAPAAQVQPSRFAVGAATLSLLARAAEDRPLAVLVDDAHLLDGPSAEALAFTGRRLVSDAVCLLAARRSSAPDDGTWAALPHLALDGLDVDAAGLLVTQVHGEVRTDQVDRLVRATGGNPLAVLELGAHLDALDTRPPETPVLLSERLCQAFLDRASVLAPDARAALLVAAADSTSLRAVLDACARLEVEPTSLAAAEDAGLVSVQGDRIEFRHPLVRSAVYGAGEPAARRAVHRALAAVIPPDAVHRLAWHLSESAVAPDEETAATLHQVAGLAAGRGAYTIAADAHERSARLTADPSLAVARLEAAGEAAWLAGRSERAVALLDEAIDGGPAPELRAHLLEVRGAVETRAGSLVAALATLTAAADEVAPVTPTLAVRLYADVVHVAFYLADPAAAMRASGRIESLLDSVDPATRSLGVLASGMAMVLGGDGREGVERLRAAAYRLVLAEDTPADRFRLPLRLQGALWLRDTGAHREVVASALLRMREEAALGSMPYLLMHVARDAATSDSWDDAEAAYLEAIRLAEETGQATELAVSHAGLAMVEARRGRAQGCRDHVAAARPLCDRHLVRLGSMWLSFALGDLASGSGDLTGAVNHFEALERLLADQGVADPDQSGAPELVELYVHLGRDAAPLATALADGFAARARAKGQAWSLARSERATALCTAGAAAEEHFRAALELHALTPDGYETARTELAFGAWLRRGRRRVDARPVLRSALETFERLGASPWTDRAAQELRATGATARRRSPDTRPDLTPQERQIAQLLAEGRTTRQAAAALFLSPKTVEYHLRHVYLKLGISSRAELVARLG